MTLHLKQNGNDKLNDDDDDDAGDDENDDDDDDLFYQVNRNYLPIFCRSSSGQNFRNVSHPSQPHPMACCVQWWRFSRLFFFFLLHPQPSTARC